MTAHTTGDRWNGDLPVEESGGYWRATSTNLIIGFSGNRYNSGFHIGGIKPGATKFLWQASPSGLMDGLGTYDNNCEYAGFMHMATGRHILFQLHGEFWRGQEANQFFHFFDNGLFVGQFGQPNLYGVRGDGSAVPGEAGNSFSPSVVDMNGEIYMYHNDESGHSASHRWHLVGAQNIQEFSNDISLSPAPVITSATVASATAGSPFSYQILASNSPTSFNALDLPSGLSVSPATGLISGTPQTPGQFNVTISASNAAGTGSAVLNITINTGPANTLVLSGLPSTASGGSAVQVVVTLKDAAGNNADSYRGTVKFTSTDTLATLPADYSFSAADAGSHTFSVTFNTGGTQSVTVTDSANNALSASASTNVSVTPPPPPPPGPGPASTLWLSNVSTAVLGAPTQYVVVAKDASGNIAPSYRGTVHFSSTDTQATLPADYTYTSADSGSHSFTIVFHSQGSQSLTVADTVNAALTATRTTNVSRTAKPGHIKHVASTVNYAKTNVDSVAVTGSVETLPDPLGVSANVTFAGVTSTFNLDSHGKGKLMTGNGASIAQGNFKLNIKKRKKAPSLAPSSTNFTFSLKRVTLRDYLVSQGIDMNANVNKVPLSADFTITIGDQVYVTTANLNFSGKAKIGGKFSQSK
jgi:hypothetical protein